MLRMILADDEPVIMRGMQHLVNWDSLGIEITGLYTEGTKAMEAILTEAPDIALLDISMPGMNGIQILKNIHEMDLGTKVIFVSGFQDFEYAQSALRYGAVEYLLKPVKREDLLAAINKAVGIAPDEKEQEKSSESENKENSDSSTEYLPVLAKLLTDPDAPRQAEKLMQFAFDSYLKKEVTEQNLGLFMSRNGQSVILLGETDADKAKEILKVLGDGAASQVRGTPVFALGSPMQGLQNMPQALRILDEKNELFYFAERGAGTVILDENETKEQQGGLERLSRIREKMKEDIIAVRQDSFEKDYEQFSRALRHTAAGRREDAIYYYCSSVRMIQDHMAEMKIAAVPIEMNDLLEKAQKCADYGELRDTFHDIFASYLDKVQESARKKDTKDIADIQNYISQHYRENLTLGVMAKEFYMNPSYFSSYFKKQTGTNFKDYVSYVRIQHALSLLVTTDMTTMEIASEVGFSDARAFSEAFVRRYGENPTSYRRRVGGKKTEAAKDSAREETT